MLEYFYQRNRNATSRQGKSTGAAATITVVRSELKAQHGLSAQEVNSNLTYLLSQGWVEEHSSASSFSTPRGGIVPRVTLYYIITAAGIDKIDGPSPFTRTRFDGIQIEASGQNVITLGDGNQVQVKYEGLGRALSELRDAVKASSLDDSAKLNLVVDIDGIQDQLLKPVPNRGVIKSLWSGVEKAAISAGLAASIAAVAPHIGPLLSGG